MNRWIETAAVYAVGVALMLAVVCAVGNGLVIIARALGMW